MRTLKLIQNGVIGEAFFSCLFVANKSVAKVFIRGSCGGGGAPDPFLLAGIDFTLHQLTLVIPLIGDSSNHFILMKG